MLLRYAALAAMVVAASGCVQERVVHERRPVQHEYVDVVAPQPPPVQVIEVEPAVREGYICHAVIGVGKAGVMWQCMAIGSRCARAIATCIRTGCSVVMATIGRSVAGYADQTSSPSVGASLLAPTKKPL